MRTPALLTCSLLAGSILLTGLASAQTNDAPYVAPRTEWGHAELRGVWNFSSPIPMTTGERVPIELIWKADQGPESEAHLNWQSHTQHIEHVPQSHLYPPEANEEKQ